MAPGNNETQPKPALTKSFFTVSTFGTLGGCASITWVVTGVIGGFFSINTGMLGLIVSIAVSYIALFLGEVRKKGDYIVALLNGFLIYSTVVGGTAFMPALNSGTAGDAQNPEVTVKSAFTTPWIKDNNMVKAINGLVDINKVQADALNKTGEKISNIRTELNTPETHMVDKKHILNQNLDSSEEIINKSAVSVNLKTATLKQYGIKIR